LLFVLFYIEKRQFETSQKSGNLHMLDLDKTQISRSESCGHVSSKLHQEPQHLNTLKNFNQLAPSYSTSPSSS